jgi:hypothetical protein
MEELQNTAGEAGINAPGVDFESMIKNIVDEKVKKAYDSTYSVAKANKDKYGLSDEDVQLAVNNLKAEREKASKNEAEKFAKMQKELEKAQATIKQYETEKFQNSVKSSSVKILNEFNITEQKDISLIQDLLGEKLYTCVSEENAFDEEKAKELITNTLDKYGLSFEKKEEAKENPYFRIGARKSEEVHDVKKLDINDRYRMQRAIKNHK